MPRRGLVFVSLLFIFAGCSKNDADTVPPLHPVKGKITKNGVAVGKGFVRFSPENTQEYSVQGMVDEAGNFTLETVRAGKSSPGAPAGTYKVVYLPETQQQLTSVAELTSTFTVEEKSNEINIELMPK